MAKDIHGAASYGTHIRELLTLGLPIVVGQIGSIVQGLADTLMVGQYSAHSLAAAGFVNNVMILVLVAAMGYSYGLTPVVGSAHARQEHNRAGAALKASLQVNGLLAIVAVGLMGFLYFHLHQLGQPDELLSEIRTYYLIVLASLPFQILFNAFKQFSDGVGDTRTPMWVMLIANVMNIVGNALLIYGIGPLPEWGLAGAGVATLVSRIFMLAAMSVLFFTHQRFSPYRRAFRTTGRLNAQRRELHRLGWPIALQMGMETASFSLSAVMMGWLGSTQLASHQVMTNVGSLCFLVYYGVGAAVAIRISHFRGVNDWANVRRTAYAGLRIILACGLMVSTAISLNSNLVSSAFTSDTEVAGIVSSLMLPFVLYQFGDGLQTCFANALRGIADVKPMVRYAFLSYIVISLPLSYVLGFPCRMDATGIWMAFPVALTTAGLLFLRRFRRHIYERMSKITA
ncbi:MAG: MATE family efflux transporter [Clostridium sp.]|nr:MATE family efflux transporter [Clostridium sp.]